MKQLVQPQLPASRESIEYSVLNHQGFHSIVRLMSSRCTVASSMISISITKATHNSQAANDR